MLLYMKSEKIGYDAKAEYFIGQKKFVVLKGALVSANISNSEKFGGAKSIEDRRKQYVTDRIVRRDVEFTSPSTAANFVSGRSTNGMISWKNDQGVKLKDLLN